MIGVNIGRKAGKRKDTAENILANRHFVVNVGDETLLDPLHDSAQEHPPEISEVDVLGLSVLPGAVIDTPRLAAAPNAAFTASRRLATPVRRSSWAKWCCSIFAMACCKTARSMRLTTSHLPHRRAELCVASPITKRGIQQTPKSIIKPEAA